MARVESDSRRGGGGTARGAPRRPGAAEALIASTPVRIASELYDQMVDHARADAPDECCGIVSRTGDEATQVYPTTNVEASQFRFVIEPNEVYRIVTEIEDAGLDLGAIYHSHTRSEPYPSQTDINFAAQWPGVMWIIIGLADGDPEVKMYEIADGEVTAAELRVR